MLTEADFAGALDDACDVDPVESRTVGLLALMGSIRGSARIAYATYACRVRTPCEFSRLCAYARSGASAEGMTGTVIPKHHDTGGAAAPTQKTKPKMAGAICKATPKRSKKASGDLIKPLSFTLKGSGTAGKVSVKIFPSFAIAVNGHIDPTGIAGLNARLLGIVERASAFLHRGEPAKSHLLMGRVDMLQVYWFTRTAIDLHAAHSTIRALIHNSDPSCPWRQGALDTGKRPMLRLSTKDGPGCNFAAVSATVQPCGTVSLVARCIPTLRRAVLLFGELARPAAASSSAWLPSDRPMTQAVP